MKTRVTSFVNGILAVCVLSGCAAYGTAVAPGDPYQTGNYYDQYSPAYSYYPGQAGYYPYSPYGYYGEYGYPYPPGYYGAPAIFGPSIYFGFGASSGSSGVGVGTTFGF